MCKMFAVLNNNPENNNIINKILAINIDGLCSEPDGYSVYRDGDLSCSMSYDTVVEDIQYKGERLYMNHFRRSTGGSKDETGLHLQKVNNNYIFAHNGWVTGIKHEDKSDSYYFFEKLTRTKVTRKSIEAAVAQDNFSGKGFLYDIKRDQLHIFCTMMMWITILDECLIFTSFKPTLEYELCSSVKTLNFEWEYKSEPKKIADVLHSDDISEKYLLFEHNKLIELKDFNTWRPNTWPHSKKQNTFPLIKTKLDIAKAYDNHTCKNASSCDICVDYFESMYEGYEHGSGFDD